MIDEQLEEMLLERLKEGLDNLNNLKPEEKAKVIRDLAVIHGLRVEELKTRWDYELKYENMEREFEVKYENMKREDEHKKREEELKKEQSRWDKINQYITHGIATAGIVFPLIFYGIWMKKGLKFEETGTYTSGTFRNLINRFRLTKH